MKTCGDGIAQARQLTAMRRNRHVCSPRPRGYGAQTWASGGPFPRGWNSPGNITKNPLTLKAL